jgi:hypothetical protein
MVSGLTSIMEATLEDDDTRRFRTTLYPVNQPVLLGDAARPLPLELISQRLGLSNSLERMPQNIPDQFIDSAYRLRIRLLPEDIVFPAAGLPRRLEEGWQAWENITVRIDASEQLYNK